MAINRRNDDVWKPRNDQSTVNHDDEFQAASLPPWNHGETKPIARHKRLDTTRDASTSPSLLSRASILDSKAIKFQNATSHRRITMNSPRPEPPKLLPHLRTKPATPPAAPPATSETQPYGHGQYRECSTFKVVVQAQQHIATQPSTTVYTDDKKAPSSRSMLERIEKAIAKRDENKKKASKEREMKNAAGYDEARRNASRREEQLKLAREEQDAGNMLLEAGSDGLAENTAPGNLQLLAMGCYEQENETSQVKTAKPRLPWAVDAKTSWQSLSTNTLAHREPAVPTYPQNNKSRRQADRGQDQANTQTCRQNVHKEQWNSKQPPDIRGQGLTMPSVRVDWNACRQTKRVTQQSCGSLPSDVVLDVDSELERYVRFWRSSIPDLGVDLRELFRIHDHWECEIDTVNGILLQPPEYPRTQPCPDDVDNQALARTSTMAVADALIAKEEEDQARQDRWDAHLEAARREAIERGEQVATSTTCDAHDTSIEDEQSLKSTDVKIPCHLRPALAADMPGVAAIYNQEVRESHRTTDSEKVSMGDFQNIFAHCKTAGMPFLVAVEGWYTEKGRHASSDQVIGFALVDTVVRGISGSSNTCTATCGKITLIVHPYYRRQRIGTAMLDAIITNCSTRHQSYEGYQFINTDDDRRFVRPIDNVRRWYNLFIEVFIKSGVTSSHQVREHDEWWICEFLETRFCTLLVEHKERMYRHRSDDEKGTYWLDRLVLQHECRDWNT